MIGRIEAVSPELGSQLDRSIVTGTYCRYQPTEPLTWAFRCGPSREQANGPGAAATTGAHLSPTT